MLFARSIRRNIAYGLELADEVEAAGEVNGATVALDSSAAAPHAQADETADADSARAPLIVRMHAAESAEAEAASAGALSTRVGMADIREAAAAANVHTFIGEMRDGYETHVGERGATISG